MPKIPRKIQEIFGNNSPSTGIVEYGTPADGNNNFTKDVNVIQNQNWLDGWAAAALSGEEIPTFQDYNAIHYVLSHNLAYLFQEGVAEWDTNTTYYQNSIVKKAGTYELYGSKTDDNTGNSLPSQTDNTNWQYLGDLANIAQIGQSAFPSGGIIIWSGSIANIPSGWALCDGNNGTPDLRDRFVVGAGNSYSVDGTGGSTSDNVNISISGTTGSTTLTESQLASHKHSIPINTRARSNTSSNADQISGGSSKNTDSTGGDSSHNHSVSGSGSDTIDTLPPYYALAYIMKL